MFLRVFLQSCISYCGEEVHRTKSAKQKKIQTILCKNKNIWVISFFDCIRVLDNLRARNFVKQNQQLNLKRKFSVSSDPKKLKIHDTNAIKLLNRLRLSFSHLNELKFWHNFRPTIDPMCSCGLEPEETLHYFWRCHFWAS